MSCCKITQTGSLGIRKDRTEQRVIPGMEVKMIGGYIWKNNAGSYCKINCIKNGESDKGNTEWKQKSGAI